jgi:hypothetical protein
VRKQASGQALGTDDKGGHGTWRSSAEG